MPKLIPLSKRHRRGRQTNLSTLLCAEPKGPNSLLNRTTRRKVSEEDMQTSSCSSNISMKTQEYNGDSSQLFLGYNFRSNGGVCAEAVNGSMSSSQVASTPSELLLEATSSMTLQSIESELQATEEQVSTRRLKRPAASSCLADLGNCIAPDSPSDFFQAASDKRSCKSPRASPPSPSPYGYFVDMFIPDDEEETFQQQTSFIPLSMCPASRARIFYGKDSDPYPRIRPQATKRQRRSSSRIPLAFNRQYQCNSNTTSTPKIPEQKPTFNNFVLSFPELDETADRLGSLRF